MNALIIQTSTIHAPQAHKDLLPKIYSKFLSGGVKTFFWDKKINSGKELVKDLQEFYSKHDFQNILFTDSSLLPTSDFKLPESNTLKNADFDRFPAFYYTSGGFESSAEEIPSNVFFNLRSSNKRPWLNLYAPSFKFWQASLLENSLELEESMNANPTLQASYQGENIPFFMNELNLLARNPDYQMSSDDINYISSEDFRVRLWKVNKYRNHTLLRTYPLPYRIKHYLKVAKLGIKASLIRYVKRPLVSVIRKSIHIFKIILGKFTKKFFGIDDPVTPLKRRANRLLRRELFHITT